MTFLKVMNWQIKICHFLWCICLQYELTWAEMSAIRQYYIKSEWHPFHLWNVARRGGLVPNHCYFLGEERLDTSKASVSLLPNLNDAAYLDPVPLLCPLALSQALFTGYGHDPVFLFDFGSIAKDGYWHHQLETDDWSFYTLFNYSPNYKQEQPTLKKFRRNK